MIIMIIAIRRRRRRRNKTIVSKITEHYTNNNRNEQVLPLGPGGTGVPGLVADDVRLWHEITRDDTR